MFRCQGIIKKDNSPSIRPTVVCHCKIRTLISSLSVSQSKNKNKNKIKKDKNIEVERGSKGDRITMIFVLDMHIRLTGGDHKLFLHFSKYDTIKVIFYIS